jgi:excisionase family DNA binding protein
MFTVAEVAKQLKVSARFVYRLVETGELLSYRVGALIRIKEEDLTSYLEGRKHRTPLPVPRRARLSVLDL